MASDKGFVVSFRPVGTLDEIKQIGWEPTKYGSCSEPDGAKNIGCSRYYECKMSYKGEPGPVGGVHNHGVEIIKSENQGHGVRQVCMSCFDIASIQPTIEAAGGLLTIIANEGETYLARGSKPSKTSTNVKDPTFVEDSWDEVVPAFPRPGENVKLFKHAYAAKLLQGARQREKDAQRRKAIGFEMEEVHLDDKPESKAVGAGARGRKDQP